MNRVKGASERKNVERVTKWPVKNAIVTQVETLGVFLVTDNRVFNGPLGRSLCSFARSAHSAHSLRSLFALLRLLCSLAPFTGLLAHSFLSHSLVGHLKFTNMHSRCVNAYNGMKRGFGRQ